jgi:polyribonucleotide nucleotidyltransferase
MEKGNLIRIEKKLGDEDLILETGKVARKSDGAVWVQYGETIVLVTAVISSTVEEGGGFLPLIVDYRERAYAAGKIPGGFFKREGAPSSEEILSCRLIDRSVRPLFPKGFRNKVQIVATVLSAGESNHPAILSIMGAYLALSISNFFSIEPIAGVRIGRIDGRFVINPSDKELSESELNLVIVGNKEGLVMMEGEARKVEDDVIAGAFQQAHSSIQELIETEEEFISAVGREKKEFHLYEIDAEMKKKVVAFACDKVKAIEKNWKKEEKNAYMEKIKEETLEEFLTEYPEEENDILDILNEFKKERMRELIIKDGKRWDLRGSDEVRSVSCEVGMLPRAHGSGLFTRGETQALVAVALGTRSDEQRIDGLHKEEIFKSFMFHYNFPPYSTGEVRFLRGPARREVGHGLLAEKAIVSILPDSSSFPYTVRLVSDVLASNGSSSMASVCGGTLALMDAGVPISEPVAGVGIGLIKEGDKTVILTDIQGMEDYLGDMDFKICGTREAVTALQLDMKVSGVSIEVLEEALSRARKARVFILDQMEAVIKEPRSQLSSHAPRITILSIPADKIGELIGPGGKVIKGITKETGAGIDIDDAEGKVTISGSDEEGVRRAVEIAKSIIRGPEVGKIYTGKVKRVTDFGAFVEIAPGKEGLVHISRLSDKFVKKVSDVVKVGDEIKVKLTEIDDLGRLNLSGKGISK